MLKSTHSYVMVTGLALVAGVTGDLLLRQFPWGVNWTIWVVILLCMAIWFNRNSVNKFDVQEKRYLGIGVVFALCYCWRASPVLQLISMGGIGFSIAFLHAQRVMAKTKWWTWKVLARVPLQGMKDFFVSYIRWINKVPTMRQRLVQPTQSKFAPWGRGMLLALPFLALYTTLFASADVTFEKWVVDILDWDREAFLTHTFVTVFYTLLALGLLILLSGYESKSHKEDDGLSKRGEIGLGVQDVTIALTLLNILFVVFVGFQIKYLFGGENIIREIDTMTYSGYARKGFFELCAVSMIVMPMLLVFHWLVSKTADGSKKGFKLNSIVMIGLLLLIMFSAFHRMVLYMDQYGLTQLRFYVSYFMVWLALLFLCLGRMVTTGQRENFVRTFVMCGFVGTLLLFPLNPDHQIMKSNITHAQHDFEFDGNYANRLSADGIPVLVKAIDEGDLKKKSFENLFHKHQDKSNWRSWNWGRWRARKIMENSPVSL